MKYHKMLLVVFFLLGVVTSSAQSAQSQEPPSLIAQSGRSVQVSRGGSAQSFQIASAIMKETRRILVVLPASYSQSAPDRRYPVTVVVDGEYLIPAVATVSDELTRNGQIPESVIVGIENVGGADFLSSNNKRVYDLTPPGLSVSGSSLNEGGDLFLDFIEKELLPAVDRQFRTAAPRTFVGISSGGVLATYVAATRSTYCAVVSLDAPIHLGDNWLAKKLTQRATTGGAPVRYASLEANFGWPEAAWNALVAKTPASWKLYREKFQLEGHETMQMLGAYLGLRQVFSDYSRFAYPQASAASILPYYAKVSASLGAPVIPPKRVLQDIVNGLLSEGHGAAAREAYHMLVSGYGAPSNSAKLLAQIAEVERRPPTETVEGLLATPFPTPEEARAFIGEWIGDIWMGPNQPRTGSTMLRIRVVDGRVVGETVRRAPTGEELVLRWQYLKITTQGMTWGRLNDRQPRGVMLFEGKLEGDTLAGNGQFAGIKLEDPPPPLNFSFKRVRVGASISAQDIPAKVDEYMNAGVKLGHFSSAILIARDGKVLVSKGYGIANYEEDIPITPQTKFRLASLTKQFTAMAILILQERGKLKVEDPICKYISECPAAWEPITIHNLLTHTSGIPDYAGLPDSDKMHKLPAPVPSLIARFKDKPLDFKPGEEFRYSNSGYALLGAIIERVSGKSYKAFLQDNVFDPLKMSNTGYDEASTILKHRARGYVRQGDRLTNAEYVDMTVPYAAGGLYSTVEDLYLWSQALLTGKLVSEKTLAAMVTPFKNNYAYGLIVKEEFSKKFINHSGAINGFTSFIGQYPNDKVTIIVLNNSVGSNLPAANIGRDLGAIVFGEKYETLTAHKEIEVDPKLYDAYVGEYERGPGRIYIINKKDDRLFYKFFDKPPFEMLPEAENKFFIKEINLQFTFVKDEKGQVTHLILHAPTGENIQARKIK